METRRKFFGKVIGLCGLAFVPSSMNFDGSGGTLAWAQLPEGDNTQLRTRFDEEIFELGRKVPYHMFDEFPVKVLRWGFFKP